MRFRTRQADHRIPTVNLVPMMDVLMTVLTFFIIISMSLTGQQLINVVLPGLSFQGPGQQKTKQSSSMSLKSLVIGLDSKGGTLMDGRLVDKALLKERIQKYLDQNPEGKIVLKADRNLAYNKVAKLLDQVSTIGGERISLAVEPKNKLTSP